MPIRTAYLIYGVCCFFYSMEYVIRKQTEHREQITETREQKSEDRRQKTDVRNQKTGNRKRKSDIEAVGCHLPESE